MRTIQELTLALYNEVAESVSGKKTIEAFLWRNAAEIFHSTMMIQSCASVIQGTDPSLPPAKAKDPFGNDIWESKTTGLTKDYINRINKSFTPTQFQREYLCKDPVVFKEPNELQKRVYGIFEKHDLIKKCECGAESIGVMKHSDYCAKHTKE
jgi:hypothetical protein